MEEYIQEGVNLICKTEQHYNIVKEGDLTEDEKEEDEEKSVIIEKEIIQIEDKTINEVKPHLEEIAEEVIEEEEQEVNIIDIIGEDKPQKEIEEQV